ncbi:unnamed protein product [Lota lota]
MALASANGLTPAVVMRYLDEEQQNRSGTVLEVRGDRPDGESGAGTSAGTPLRDEGRETIHSRLTPQHILLLSQRSGVAHGCLSAPEPRASSGPPSPGGRGGARGPGPHPACLVGMVKKAHCQRYRCVTNGKLTQIPLHKRSAGLEQLCMASSDQGYAALEPNY